ncbi:MAG: 4Fe-4S dicluster domain-containing protein, partial [Calditrichaeota bacterium]
LYLAATGKDGRGYEQVRETWRAFLSKANFEKQWRRVLHDGVLQKSALPRRRPALNPGRIAQSLATNPLPKDAATKENLEIVFHVSHSVFDGRFANNGWLQELPDPVTKITWDNALLMSHRTARELHLENGDVVHMEYQGKRVKLPVWVVPGQADYSLSIELGYGRQNLGRIADGVGFDAYLLRESKARDFDTGVTLIKSGETYILATTQNHNSMEGRPIIREATLEHYREEPHFAREMVELLPLRSLWKEHSYDKGYQWGMTIDLNACTGCNACVVACQSENNVPIVGKEQVWRGREMHWIRIDRYFEGGLDAPEMVYQPVTCQHCENAPCEQVCPVQATQHDAEGLNVMVYNRCIGTRYCSNNCPYKVRRFNFFNYTSETPEIVKMAMNPDVTVRFRGVMEKCTYCLQRINFAKIQAKKENREVRDGEIVTACQQTCPTDAIVFGKIRDPQSQVSQLKKLDRTYELLAEFNVKPRTTYLAKLRNPHPELMKSEATEHSPA